MQILLTKPQNNHVAFYNYVRAFLSHEFFLWVQRKQIIL
jgi:hypothetical protein